MDLHTKLAELSVADNAMKPTPATEFKETVEVVSSYFEISIGQNALAYRYEVDILAISQRGQEKNLTRGPADDGAASLRRQLCHEVFNAALKKSNGFGTKQGVRLPVVYDCRATLFLPAPLKMEDEVVVILDKDADFAEMSKETLFTLDPTDVIRVRIAPTTQNAFEMDLRAELMKADFCEPDCEFARDRSFRTFLEMLTSVNAVRSGSHTQLGVGNFFDNDPSMIVDIGDAKCLRPGLSKGVRVVEKDDRPYPALVVDAKSSCFFKAQNLAQSIMELGRQKGRPDDMWKTARFLFKDVRVISAPVDKKGRVKSFPIRAITKMPATELNVKVKGFNGSLADYYARVLKIKLQHPNFMCVEADVPGPKKEFFPVEVLFVSPNQRVPIEKTEANQSSIVLKANAIKPDRRIKNIKDQMSRMSLFANTPVMEAFKVFVCPDFIRLTAGVRVAPQISMGDRDVKIDQKKANWAKEANGANYKQESFSLDSWAVLYANTEPGLIRQFVQRYVAAAQRRGFTVREPTILKFNQDFERTFSECIDNDIRFLMLIDPKYVKTHESLKLFERLCHVLTQHVSLERVFDVVQKNSRMTLDNILSKTHMKLGGLNYVPIIENVGSRFALDSGEVLVIGYDVAHPTAMSPQERRLVRSLNLDVKSLEPSVVGITANCSFNPHEFIGDYHYQTARKESIDVSILERRMVWIMRLLEKNRPDQCRPKHVVILRDGVSEGQYDMARNEEMAALRDGLKLVDPEYNPTFTLVIATKRHNKRFFGQDGRNYVNTDPGTVIDKTVVRKDVPEFFLQSHYPLQGTVKIPQYNKLHDEANFSMDELQAFVNCLCHTHQIVNLAVSIPEPIYQADELAKRGRNNYAELRRRFTSEVPRMNEAGVIDCNALTKILSYWDSPLEAVRFTA
ncbi:hypothetical protein L596_016139 [Steinernema carpocapsae]|uniref:Piwi domain-containing protein n=1 Tax=Steinernema carpocapsae TaxID=34508 RepID=A0A4U5NH79_STECR|nr:hypothetical protein L596_016139 [Steinernema carpocapsae]